ncbi:MAG: hypothetical protein HYW48_06065 [Deltaproteobacteria bacterium]|nr:hypothetical protein [Deltaproteobacteria bacterium]
MLRRIAIISCLSVLPLSALAAPSYSCKGVRVPGLYLKPGAPDAQDKIENKAFLKIKVDEAGQYIAELREKARDKVQKSPVVGCEEVSSSDAQWFLRNFDAHLTFPKISIGNVERGTFCEVNYGKRRNPKKAKLYYFYDASKVAGKLVLLSGQLGECMH